MRSALSSDLIWSWLLMFGWGSKLNLGQDSEARFGEDFDFKFSRDADVCFRFNLMLNRDSKIEFDQDLCKNLWYELNPRVRCAFGNVSFYLFSAFAFYSTPFQNSFLFSLICSKQRHFPQECILPWTAHLWSAIGCSLWSTFCYFSLIYCLLLITFYSFIASSIFPPRLWTASTSPRLPLPD